MGVGLWRALADEFELLLKELLPRGAAWSREEGRLSDLLGGLSVEPGRVHNRAVDFMSEVDPRSAAETLDEWERIAGLPDPAVGQPSTIDGRRKALHARVTAYGGASPAYFIEIAAKLGKTITIEEPGLSLWRVGTSGVDEPITGFGWAYTWIVHGLTSDAIRFMVGTSGVDEPLVDWGTASIEALFNRLKPAHTRVLFEYV